MKLTDSKPTNIFYMQIIGLCICLFCVCVKLSAAPCPNDSLKTIYENSMFQTYCQKVVNSSMAIADGTVDDFIGQFRGDPELLFEWALKDLGQQTDNDKNAVILELKSTTFNPETSVGAILTDIVVPGFTTFKDINIDSKVTKTKLANGSTRVFVDVYYSNSFLKKAYGTFYVKPISNNQVLLTINVNVKFGWFFDIFITQRRYKNIAEWRINGFMENMKKEAEYRYNK